MQATASHTDVLLEIGELTAGYGAQPVLHGISLHVARNEFVAVIGANTAGKSTLLRAISGLLPQCRGRIAFEGRDLTRMKAHQIAGLGIAHVPEGRHVFPEMTVEENLRMGAFSHADKGAVQQALERVFELFPRLKERRMQYAGSMSGGEQQMVAVGRGMMLEPKLLILDEPKPRPCADGGGGNAPALPRHPPLRRHGAAGRAERVAGPAQRGTGLCDGLGRDRDRGLGARAAA